MPARLLDVAPAYIVLRPFNANGVDVERGEIVDCTDWKNVQPLINNRRLRPVPHDYEAKVVECSCERKWEDEDAAKLHVCPEEVVVAVAKRRGRPPRQHSEVM